MTELTQKDILRKERAKRFEQAIESVSNITGNNAHKYPLCKINARRNELIMHIYNRHSDSKSKKFLSLISRKTKSTINEAKSKLGTNSDGLPASQARGRKVHLSGNAFRPYQGGIPGSGKKS